MDPIFPSQGIRQRNLLSPYLVILCMKVLGHIIKENAVKGDGFLLKAPTVGTFSHLFFANDLVLFAKADHVNCSTIRDVLDAFCARLRQSISESKSRVYSLQMLMWTLEKLV